MKIISVRNLYQCDHSSSTYHFYTERSLSDKERAAVQKFAGVKPGRHSLDIHRGGDWELSMEVEDELLEKYYDVMISESYDWWTARVALDYSEELWNALKPCEGRGEEDLGVDVEREGSRILVSFYFAVDYDSAFRVLGEELFEELTDLFLYIREDILGGDFSALKVICDFYDAEVETDWKGVGTVSKAARKFGKILGRV